MKHSSRASVGGAQKLVLFTLITAMTLPSPFAFSQGQSPALSLEAYLEQVKTQNEGVKGAIKGSQGAFERREEGSLNFSPELFANAQLASNQRETTAPVFMGTQTDQNTYSLGVRQTTRWGMQARLSYDYNYNAILGADPQIQRLPNYYTTGLNLEFTQPLWKNGFGRQTRALEEVQNSAALAEAYNLRFAAKASLAEAEQAYWRLALAREILISRQQLLKNAEELRDWTSRRVRLRLADRADLLQSNALLETRRLELQAARDEIDEASRAFNTIRGLNSNEVPETVAHLEVKMIDQLKIPDRMEMREDVKAAAEESDAAVALSRISQEGFKPTVDVFASLSLTGLDREGSEAFSEAFTTQYPVRAVGLRFSVPLDLGNLAKVRSGYRAQVESTDLRYQRRLFEQERLWNDLVKNFNNAKGRLVLARDIEKAQAEKLKYERQRQRLGRTTTFQVIQFEQEFGSAQLARIQLQGQVLTLTAQLKTFAENNDLGGQL